MARRLKNEEVRNSDVYPATSRYREVRYYQRELRGIGLRIEPETWVPPDLEQQEDDLYTEVAAGEVGRLDLVSLRVYRISALWWVIAYANGIIDPFEEATVGRVLRYPTFQRVAATILA